VVHGVSVSATGGVDGVAGVAGVAGVDGGVAEATSERGSAVAQV